MQVCPNLLQVKLDSFHFAPLPSPGDKVDVFSFEIKKRGTAPTEHSRCSSFLSQGAWNSQLFHDSIPLSVVRVDRTTTQAFRNGQTPEVCGKQADNKGIVNPRGLTPGKALGLRITDMDLGDGITGRSILREGEILPAQRHKLSRMKHAQKTDHSDKSPVGP